MPKRTDLKTILIIGSGPIVIGQACEFDYSGTQAVKALKEEGYKVILVNSNPATIMTDQNFADATYIEPIRKEFIERVIAKEKPDALLPTIGGQTALNVTLELAEAGILDKYNVELIGANTSAIRAAEDREEFKEVAKRVGLDVAQSRLVTTWEEAKSAVKEIGYPFIIRPSRTLGGAGGGTVESAEQFEEMVSRGFNASPNHELLFEESLVGWKEIELEVMRDSFDNTVIICGIENIDPMGVHTGDSITVAPIQTLTDKEYQSLRDKALRLMKEIGVDTGGSNVQFTIDPKTGRQLVIEMNPRVSRSSALASKATGFPIAKIAAKLAVGYSLAELPNDITKKTPACFEPSIDYVVVKIPRFTFEKFPQADAELGTQMKSVGEAMAIGRTFSEALQKACRSLETGRTGLCGGPESKINNISELEDLLVHQSDNRLFLVARGLELGLSIERLFELTAFDPWFLEQMHQVVKIESKLLSDQVALDTLSAEDMRFCKSKGLSDARMAELLSVSEKEIRSKRLALGVRPSYKMVDTCAAEFSSDTPYLYSSYDENSDAEVSDKKKIIILGGGPNRIGQGLEFDYCCVHAAMSLRDAGYETIMINCNPETVSTDYDTSDRLYFEPLTFEDVLEVVEREKPEGVIVQYGGQTPLRLSQALEAAGVPVIGTSPDAIEATEDRKIFSELLSSLNIQQAESGTATNETEALQVADQIGFPLMVRPSYVLGGRAMAIIHDADELKSYINESVEVSFDRPVLLDRFLDDAIEVDVDALYDGTDKVICGLVEHIERAGVHSGDSSFLMPSQTLSEETLQKIQSTTYALLEACNVRGLMNVQYAVRKGELYVLEVNPRASRSVPFVSKVVGIPWAKVAARVMAGESLKDIHTSGVYGPALNFHNYLEVISSMNYVAVKQSVFPFVKFPGSDAILGPEMRSTGEVMGIDRDASGAFMRAQSAAGTDLPLTGKVFFSLKDEDKKSGLSLAQRLEAIGFTLLATSGTAAFLMDNGVHAEVVNKVRDGSPHVVDHIESGDISLIINTPEGSGPLLDSRSIRATAVQVRTPLYTTIAAAEAAVKSVERAVKQKDFGVTSIQDFLSEFKTAA